MSQPTLFDPLPVSLPAYQRGSDTSKRAAEKVQRSGKVARDRRLILAWVTGEAFNGATQRELSERLGIARASVAARCNELAGGKILDGKREHDALILPTVRRRDGCAVYVTKAIYQRTESAAA